MRWLSKSKGISNVYENSTREGLTRRRRPASSMPSSWETPRYRVSSFATGSVDGMAGKKEPMGAWRPVVPSWSREGRRRKGSKFPKLVCLGAWANNIYVVRCNPGGGGVLESIKEGESGRRGIKPLLLAIVIESERAGLLRGRLRRQMWKRVWKRIGAESGMQRLLMEVALGRIKRRSETSNSVNVPDLRA